jgi:hypothetical protein
MVSLLRLAAFGHWNHLRPIWGRFFVYVLKMSNLPAQFL